MRENAEPLIVETGRQLFLDHSHSNTDASANSKQPQPPNPQPATPPLHPPQPAAYSVDSDNAPLSARPQPSTSPAHPHGSQPSPCIAPRQKHCALQEPALC